MFYECKMCGHDIRDDQEAACPHSKLDPASIAWTKFGQWLIKYRDSHPEDERDDYELALIYPGPIDLLESHSNDL